jgi:hypothetical protein
MKEYAKIFPLPEMLPSDLAFVSLLDKNGVLEVAFDSKGGSVLFVQFKYFVAYRRGDEGDFLKSFGLIDSPELAGHMIYEIFNSEFIAWLVEESCTARARTPLRHFHFSSPLEIVDVISYDEPRFIFEEKCQHIHSELRP